MEKNQTISVEELKSRLLQQRTTTQRFRWPLETGQAYTLLYAAYQAEVERRHRVFVKDPHTMDVLKALAEHFTTDTPKYGIFFCGKCGNGKTTMVKALQNAVWYLIEKKVLPRESEIKIRDAKELVKLATDNPELFYKTMRIPMLSLEDIGREPAEVLDYGNVMSPMIDLLEYRYDNQLFTVISTNLLPKEISEKYGVRIADRFNEQYERFVFKQDSYRL